MGRTPQISTAYLIGGIVITLLGTPVLGASIQGTEYQDELKNGSQTVHLSPVYTSVRYSISKYISGKSVEQSNQPSTAPSTAADSTLLPSEIDQVTERLHISKSKNQSGVFPTKNRTSTPEASLESKKKPLVISPISSLLKEEHASNDTVTPSSNIQEETQTENASSPSTPYLSLTDTESTSISSQLSQHSADDGATENRGETDRISENETQMIVNTERNELAASSEIEYTAKKPDDLNAEATALHSRYEPEESVVKHSHTREGESQSVAVLENEDEILTSASSNEDKIERYSIPKEATDIIALNAQLLGYSASEYQSTDEWQSPKHNTAELREDEQDISTVIDTIEITTIPPIETTTRKRTYRRRRRRRKGQTSGTSRTRQTTESYQGGEDIHLETTTNIPSGEAVEQESTTDRPLSPARNRYGTRKVNYTVRSTTEDYRRETLATSETSHDGQNTDVEKSRGRARSQAYRRRRPRYRVSVRRRNNHTLVNDENDTWENGQPKEVSHSSVIPNPTESIYQETTESLPSQQETEYFPVTTLRTHIIQAINELQQINTLIASRKDDISNYTKNDALPQPLILQSRPLTQNSLETNFSQNERSFLRNLNLPDQEMAKLLLSLLNRTHTRTPINAEPLPQQDLYQENFGGITENLQRFRNYTKQYEGEFSPAASTIDKNVNSIQQGSHQPTYYIRNDTQGGTLSSVYLRDGISVKELVERDLVTSEQQRQYHRRPANSVPNICQNNTIPEIIDCIRNIEQRKSPVRKSSYNAARKTPTRDFTQVTQVDDLKIHRSSRNSSVSDIPALVDQRYKGSDISEQRYKVRSNRDFSSAQIYSKPTERGISIKSTTQQYSTNFSPSSLNQKTVSSTSKLGLTYPYTPGSGKPTASKPISNNNIANSVSNSLSGALKVGGRMLLSHLQRLRNVILQIPGHIGRLSAEVGDHKQPQKSKSKSSSTSTSLFTPRSSSSLIWR